MQTLSPKVILVIDPDHDTRVMFRRTFEEAGHFVVSSPDGAEALLRLRDVTPPSIVFLSAETVMMSGETFLKLLRAHEAHRDTPAVQIKKRGHADMPGTICSLEAPFTADKLLSCLSHCLSNNSQPTV